MELVRRVLSFPAAGRSTMDNSMRFIAGAMKIGTHGYDHSNRTSFVDPAQRRERLTAGKQSVERYAPLGYRAPSLLRTKELLADLASFYSYDSSIPSSGGLFPVPNNGCATAR